MNEVPFDDLDRFVSYAEKHFELPLLAGCFASERCDPKIPSRAVGLSLLLGEVAHIPSLSQLEEETKLPQCNAGWATRTGSATMPSAMPATG